MSFIDRANIGMEPLLDSCLLASNFLMMTDPCVCLGNAKIEGLMEDLNLTGDQYNIAVSIFFIGYVLLGKIPSHYSVFISTPALPTSSNL